MLDVARLRSETPGCARVAHLNNAGSSLPPAVVVDRVVDHLRLEAELGGYEAADAVADESAAIPVAIAELINADAGEIALVDSATRAWLQAFTAIPFERGDRILTTSAEYASNVIGMLDVARRHGVTVERAPSTPTGEVDVDALARALDDRVRVVAVTHAPTNGGLLQPVAAIGEAVRDARALFVLDACQSIGQMPIDVRALGVDVLSATGRKYLRGPRGTGFLYVRRALIGELQPAHVDLHSGHVTGAETYALHDDARRFELWERSIAANLGLGVAARYLLDVGQAAAWERIQAVATALREALALTWRVELCDIGSELSGIVSFRVRDEEPAAVKERLRAAGVHVSVSGAPSTPWDMGARGLDSVVRASVHYFTDEADLDALVSRV